MLLVTQGQTHAHARVMGSEVLAACKLIKFPVRSCGLFAYKHMTLIMLSNVCWSCPGQALGFRQGIAECN